MKKLNNEGYKNLLTEVQELVLKGKNKAYKAIDNILVETRWQIGERIVREELKYQSRANYGEYLVKKLAADLGVKKQRFSEIVRFYKCYPIVRTLSGQLSWSHYTELLELNDSQERKFYETKIIVNSWSIRELRLQIKNRLYQHTDQKEVTNFRKVVTPAIVDIQKLFKPEYNLDFLAISSHQEKDLEDKIINKIEDFLRELGTDFSFLKRQATILIDSEKHFIDLVLYHRGIPCTILVDLKAGKLDSRDVGQMNKYVSYYRCNRQYAFEAETIGLIICREIGYEEAVYALAGLEKKIFVAKYKTKLPSREQLKKVIKKIETF